MKNIIGAIVLTLLTVGCTNNTVDNVNFSAQLKNDTSNIHVGDTVRFSLSGNPDYLVFYSGENGNAYVKRNNTKAEVNGLTFSYTATEQYIDKDKYITNPVLSVLISENYTGDTAKIKSATWIDVSSKLAVPRPTKDAPTTVLAYGNFNEYINKKFYIAFKYLAVGRDKPARTGLPRVDILNPKLTKKINNDSIVQDNAVAQLGFSIIPIKTAEKTKYSVSPTSFLFQPATPVDATKEVEVWMISQAIDATAVDPDAGTPIKTLSAALTAYTYIYTKPGTYTVSFLASNANKWSSSTVVKEFTFRVK